ncbi:NADP-dependent isopropanol dehydrogenase [Tritrichomonas foetus]|uniref:NADP-dependent isopropanol dehydrogenase n=1 Tax=Tritrichomonas foetus TaxID=1144522 RepID=A0A1J4JQ75_9EUKA|nr:NADP-dependent isopropanol dehydrogenase [Tritrichomonas foetus]|eukprot:OHT00898.1 NADP-dependent isopropanol dehydrogenase [Tritrichomonas foetus]
MSHTVRSFCCLDKDKPGWKDVTLPEMGPLDAILKPIAMCPCTSDVHIVELNMYGECTLGHEVVGEIVEVGSMVKDFKPGDKVLVPAVTPDWNAALSQGGFAQHGTGYAEGFKFSHSKPGVFAELFHVNDADANLAHLPENMDLKAALMCGDMMTTGFYGAELAQIEYGDRVCVIGIGPVGLMAVRACAIGGASEIYAVGSRPNCQQIAKEYGATHIINYKNGDIVEQVRKLTNGEGVDKVIIAGGDVGIISQGIAMTHPGGIVANVAVVGGEPNVPIPINAIGWGLGLSDISIVGGLCPGGRRRLERMARLITSGRVDPTRLTNLVFTGFDKIEDAFEKMWHKPADLIKPVVIC